MNFDYDNIFIDDNDNCDLTIFQGKTKSHQQEQQEVLNILPFYHLFQSSH